MRRVQRQGWVREGYEPVARAFEANLACGGEIGAACAVFVDGEPALDIWGGLADATRGSAWERDTIAPVFSVSKGVAAVCVLHLVQRGYLELDTPLANYWPEFGQHGKDKVTVRQALAHRAGVPFIDGEVTLRELGNTEHMAPRLAAQRPFFEPGSTHTYHAITIGLITSEVVRRVTGLTLGRWLDANISRPLGFSLYAGLPARERRRTARFDYRDPVRSNEAIVALDVDSRRAITMNGVLSFAADLGAASLNDYAVQSIELAGAGMIADARSLAALYTACLQPLKGVHLLSDDLIADSTRPVSTGIQFNTNFEGPSWGAGLMTPWAVQPMLGPASFGHDGMGGALAFADPELRVGFAYVRNGLAVGGVKDPEVYAVVEALHEVLIRKKSALDSTQ